MCCAAGGCRVTSDDISLRLTITLPTWVDEGRADPTLRATWKTCFEDLQAAEAGHKEIAVAAAEPINKLTHGATAAGSCGALENTQSRRAADCRYG